MPIIVTFIFAVLRATAYTTLGRLHAVFST